MTKKKKSNKLKMDAALFVPMFGDLSDGAFLAVAEDCGVSIDDLANYADRQRRRKKNAKVHRTPVSNRTREDQDGD